MPNSVIIVHSFAQTCAALTAAVELSKDLTLLSAPDAGLQSGPAWFLALAQQARDSVPGAERLEITVLLDCGDAPGIVLAALRHGLTDVCFTGSPDRLNKLTEIAEQHGARIVTQRPEGLDLLAVADPLIRCRAWLASRSD